MDSISLSVAFISGVLSFLSPCVLPLIPSYISYITGITLKEFEDNVDKEKIRNLTIINSLFFIAGFSFVFISLGAAASILGQVFFKFREILRIGGGILVIIFGLHIMGAFESRFLNLYKKFNLKTKPIGLLGSFIVGIVFAAGWTPCVGPILGSILVLAGTSQTLGEGVFLLTVYSLGLGIPFFISSLAINSFLSYYKKLGRYFKIINIISGILLIIIGLLLISGYFQLISSFSFTK